MVAARSDDRAFWFDRCTPITRPRAHCFPQNRPGLQNVIRAYSGLALLFGALAVAEVFLHGFLRNSLQMRRDPPDVTEGIAKAPASITVDLIRNREKLVEAGGPGAGAQGVGIFDVQIDVGRGSAEGQRSGHHRPGKLVRNHDARISNLDFRVSDSAVFHVHAIGFARIEDLFVQLDGFRCIPNDEVRGDRSKARSRAASFCVVHDGRIADLRATVL